MTGIKAAQSLNSQTQFLNSQNNLNVLPSANPSFVRAEPGGRPRNGLSCLRCFSPSGDAQAHASASYQRAPSPSTFNVTECNDNPHVAPSAPPSGNRLEEVFNFFPADIQTILQSWKLRPEFIIRLLQSNHQEILSRPELCNFLNDQGIINIVMQHPSGPPSHEEVVNFLRDNGINQNFITPARIAKLFNEQAIFLIDTSGSMTREVQQGNPSTQSNHFAEPLKIETRAQEQKRRGLENLLLCKLFCQRPTPLYLFNAPTIPNSSPFSVATHQAYDNIWGLTPLSKKMEQIRQDMIINASETTEHLPGAIIYISTDGEPDEGKDRFRAQLLDLAQNGLTVWSANGQSYKRKVRISIQYIGDDPKTAEYYNKLDEQSRNIDVNDDPRSERIQLNQNKYFVTRFHGEVSDKDIALKNLIGSLSRTIDSADERSFLGMMWNRIRFW